MRKEIESAEMSDAVWLAGWVVGWSVGVMAICTAAVSGCFATSPEREACYAQARTDYWAKVEKCAADGLTEDECPLDQFDAEMKEKQEGCP